MIASLRGIVIDKGLDFVVIECGGVGYRCEATPTTLASLVRGEESRVLTTMIVREDSHTLFAFTQESEREAFRLLRSVSGVGVKSALALLAVSSPAALARAIQGGEIKTLQRAPGIGKRTAERIVVELKDKVAALATVATDSAATLGTTSPSDAAAHGLDATDANREDVLAFPIQPVTQVSEQVVEALTGLGFTEKQASATVDAVVAQWDATSPGQFFDASNVLRAALASLGKNG